MVVMRLASENEAIALAIHSFIHGFYGQLAHLTKLRFFIRKRDRQESDIDKQKDHRQETVKIKIKAFTVCGEKSNVQQTKAF